MMIYIYNIYICLIPCVSLSFGIHHSVTGQLNLHALQHPEQNEAERFGFNPHQPQWSLLSFQLLGVYRWVP